MSGQKQQIGQSGIQSDAYPADPGTQERQLNIKEENHGRARNKSSRSRNSRHGTVGRPNQRFEEYVSQPFGYDLGPAGRKDGDRRD